MNLFESLRKLYESYNCVVAYDNLGKPTYIVKGMNDFYCVTTDIRKATRFNREDAETIVKKYKSYVPSKDFKIIEKAFESYDSISGDQTLDEIATQIEITFDEKFKAEFGVSELYSNTLFNATDNISDEDFSNGYDIRLTVQCSPNEADKVISFAEKFAAEFNYDTRNVSDTCLDILVNLDNYSYDEKDNDSVNIIKETFDRSRKLTESTAKQHEDEPEEIIEWDEDVFDDEYDPGE